MLEDRLELDELEEQLGELVEYGQELGELEEQLGELVADSLGLGEFGREVLTFLLVEL